jgi:hypothetical protein
MELEEVSANAAVRGVLTDSLATTPKVMWYGDSALETGPESPG